MRHPASVPAADAAVLDAMAEHISLVLDAWDEMARFTRWEATPDSYCADERRRLRRHYGPGGDWADVASRYASGTANTMLAVGAQHLEAVVVLLRGRQVIFPLALPVRSLLEISSYVAWLLDPRLTARQRGARAHLARIDDLTRARTVAAQLGHGSAERYALQVKQLRSRHLEALFYPSEIEIDRGGTLTIAGQRSPGLTASMQYLEEVHEAKAWNAAGMYGWLSNASHPTPHVATEIAVRRGDLHRFELEDATYPYRLCRAGLMSFIKGWALLAAYLGHDQDLPGDLGEAIADLPQP
jgi:hypothetical protein